MKITPLIAAAGMAAASLGMAPAHSETRTVIAVGAPVGPGWVAYHDRGWHRGWDGPRYWDHDGPHRGWYNWHNNYYQNCSYRWSHHRRVREWHCW
jgi:predicted amidohydrolase